MDNVVHLPAPLTDIPSKLRELADRIEKGEQQASFAMVIIPVEGDWPSVFSFGEDMGDYGRVGVLEVAKGFFVNHKVSR